MEDFERYFLFMEACSTLHRTIEILYVVDGYEVTICHDGEPIAGPFWGENLSHAVMMAEREYKL